MPELFEPTSIKSLSLVNRFVRSATWEGLADENGAPTPRLVNLMADLARGGVGLIISSHSVVSRDGRSFRWKLGLYDPSVLPGLRRMAETVHEEGGVIALQIAHGGIRADSGLTGTQPMGPSIHDVGGGKQAREMSLADIQRIKGDFVRAAAMAREAGFDAVQIHAAHGYLLSQFLSPYYNRRHDRYGGATANRARLTVELLEDVRREVGNVASHNK
jgi:2,4-dienoyl-CoA reductase-like NADH-dependent reductase (Old Yellow Enzyme family)